MRPGFWLNGSVWKGGWNRDGHTWTSSPAVKARSPAPVRITARTEGSCESRLKIAERFCHMLEGCV